MKLQLVGHDYKYAVEQIMLALFPDERPIYSSDHVVGSDDLFAESRLSFGNVFAQSVTVIHYGGKVFRGVSRVRRDGLRGKLVTDRLLQRIIKQSFFRAAADCLDDPPVWGSLTGIRPAQLAASALESGMGESAAARSLMREYYVSPERAKMCVKAAQSALALKRTLSPGDAALYVGIPFCPSRCSYCSFVSNSVEKSFGFIEPFVDTLLREIETASAIARDAGMRIVSVYIGGGTPTALPSEALEAVMSALETSFDLSFVREYTVEAGRPDTVTAQKLEIIKRHGAGRVCINPQSMSDDVLKAIGRLHTPEDVFEAVRLTKQSGVALNMDVIAGLPGDSPEGFRNTLDTVMGMNPENITIHTLSLKKGSRIMLDKTAIPCCKDVAEMLDYASYSLRESGFFPYYLYRQKFMSGGFENIGWCLPGHEGIYNICMMEELCTVLSLGGGGVTKLVLQDGRIERVFNAKYPKEYILQEDKIMDKFERIRGFLAAGD